ncbi:hypothetical protein ACH6EH_06525 [Paenibacillus sp. JSM ZJ436]|uniref:hypothetical protein n=1 Tax=Paenibacillus sp. JSM ZJ436 TaxID=3376190 RepID=UPI0037AECE1E
MQNSNSLEQTYKIIAEVVRTEIRNMGLLNGDWHLGKVESVISTSRLNVFVDGATVSQPIPCNPDVTFAPGNEVIVVFLNGNTRDKFVICRRAI